MKMNKQEAIEKIKNIGTLNINDNYAGQQVDMVIKNEVLDIISQIHEPQKVVVPKFVADWYEEIKGNFYLNLHYRAWDMFESLDENSCGPEKPLADDFTRWYYNTKNAIQTLVNMHQFGYEIEKEQLYTVEIADAILTKITRGRSVQYKMLPSKDVSDVFDKGIYATRLTETEIKQKDKRLWQFANPVEEDK